MGAEQNYPGKNTNSDILHKMEIEHTELIKVLSMLQTDLNYIKEDLKDIKEEIKKISQIEQRMAVSDKDIDGIKRTIENIKKEIEDCEKRQDEIEKKINEIVLSELTKLNDRIEVLEKSKGTYNEIVKHIAKYILTFVVGALIMLILLHSHHIMQLVK